MDDGTRNENDIDGAISEAVTVLAEIHRQSLSPGMARAYLLALRDLTPTQFAAANERALKTCRFMPSPAELRDLAGANGFQYPELVSRKRP